MIEKAGVVNEYILKFDQGAEWMMGKHFNYVESYDEDGVTFHIVELSINGNMQLFRMPDFVLTFSKPVDFTENTDISHDIETISTTPIQNHSEQKKVPEKPPMSAKTAKNGQCQAITKNGKQCRKQAIDGKYCKQHAGIN